LEPTASWLVGGDKSTQATKTLPAPFGSPCAMPIIVSPLHFRLQTRHRHVWGIARALGDIARAKGMGRRPEAANDPDRRGGGLSRESL